MRRYFSNTTLFMAFCVLLFSAMFTTNGLSQNKPAQGAASPQAQAPLKITELQVKAGMGMEWENFLKDALKPALQKAGVQQFGVWKTEQFGIADKYLIVTRINSMAELDNPAPLVKVLGQFGVATVMSKIQELTYGARFYMVSPVADLSIPPKAGYVPKIAVLATTTVAPGRDQEFIKNGKQGVALIGKTNAKANIVGRVSLGGNPNEFISCVMFDSFADLGQFPQAYAKAVAEVKPTPQAAGVVLNNEWVVIRYIDELSIRPPGQ